MATLAGVSKLEKTPRYIDTMQKIELALATVSENSNHQTIFPEDDHNDYQLIADCITLCLDIENEIINIHNFICEKYRPKLPDLETLVPHPIDYARIVKQIGNETDLALVNFVGLLPNATIIALSATTLGNPLPKQVLHETTDACDRALSLDSSRKQVLGLVETCMGRIAPNLSAVVGSTVAAKLVATGGGLPALANMPACNVRLLGGSKSDSFAGFSTGCYFSETEILQSTPPGLRARACRAVAGKAALAARVDSIRGDPAGNAGRAMAGEIRKKIYRWQEAGPGRRPVVLAVPLEERRKRRGGRRTRRRRERYGMTETRRMANRVRFGVAEESEFGDGVGRGFGMLGSGNLRVVSVARNKLGVKVGKKVKDKNRGTSGFSSSLGLTTEVGMELLNPKAFADWLESGTQSKYF